MIVTGMSLRLVEMLAQRIFRRFLKICVDRRVNPETFVHGAVPSDRCDDLLADVIDCIGLSLRILPAANGKFFGLCAGAPNAIDQSEIAHAAKKKIAGPPRPGSL